MFITLNNSATAGRRSIISSVIVLIAEIIEIIIVRSVFVQFNLLH